jgi:hypothetical protein
MPVEFLTDDEAAAYGRYAGAPSQADLERVFFLDDDDRALVGRHRGERMRCRSRCMPDAASSSRNTSILLSSHVRLGTWQVFHPPATELGYAERPVAVTQRSSARYRHWPFRCCSSPVFPQSSRELKVPQPEPRDLRGL